MSARRRIPALLALVVVAGIAPAPDTAEADPFAAVPVDSGALEDWQFEDALDDDPDEGAFLVPDEDGAAPGPGRRAPWSRGRLRVAAGEHALLVAAGRGALAGEVLLAREAGEPRTIDDAYGALTVRPGAATRLRAGWIEPRLGAGLVLGPRSVSTTVATAPARASPFFAAPLSAVPTRAAAGFRGIGIERASGPLRVGVLAASTPREARPSGGALRPLLGVRHRDAGEEARRGLLGERLLALAVAWDPRPAVRAWGVVLATRTDPRRGPYDGSSAAAESAATVATGGAGGEVGAAWTGRGAGAGALEGALAWDAGGRTRMRFAATAAAGPGTRAGIVVATEARGFVPPRALPERRAHVHVGARLERRAAIPWTLEAHAVDRGPELRRRLWLALSARPARGVRLDLRHDGEPRRTRVAVRVEGDARAPVRGAAGAEARFDPAGLSRRTAWIAATAALPGRLRVRLETRLAGGRSGVAWIADDVSGGRLVRPGPSAARTRLEIGGRGAVAPRLSWARTTSPEGHSDEVRLGVHWSAGPPPGSRE